MFQLAQNLRHSGFLSLRKQGKISVDKLRTFGSEDLTVGASTVAKKKHDAVPVKQINFKATLELAQELEELAEGFGQDVSGFIRLVLKENLITYRRRLRAMREDVDDPQ